MYQLDATLYRNPETPGSYVYYRGEKKNNDATLDEDSLVSGLVGCFVCVALFLLLLFSISYPISYYNNNNNNKIGRAHV